MQLLLAVPFLLGLPSINPWTSLIGDKPSAQLRRAAYKTDPVAFIQECLTEPNGTPARPHAGQIELLRNIAPSTDVCAGRQWGKSKSMGWYATWAAVTHANWDIYIIGPSLDQARIIFNEVAGHFRRLPLSMLVEGKVHEYPFPKAPLKNGSSIHARGANNPQFIRGKNAHVIICDEASFFKDSTLTDVIEPMQTVTSNVPGACTVRITTPFGTGAFYEYFQEGLSCTDGSARSFHFPSTSNPHANAARLEKIKNRYGEDSLVWQTEYLANFVDSDLAVFPWTNVKHALDAYPYQEFPHHDPNHKYVQGVDLANVRDFFVSTVLDTSDKNLVSLVNIERYQQRGYDAIKRTVRDVYTKYGNPHTLVDATSLGESVVSDLKDIHAEGYKFSSQSKYEVVQELARRFSEHKIAIPQDRNLIDELRYFSWYFTPAKNLRMEAAHGHDDIIMSLALANHLAETAHLGGWFQSVNLERHPRDVDPAEWFNE